MMIRWMEHGITATRTIRRDRMTGRSWRMNPYRSLAFNTFLFGLSTFGSRFLNFLLTPFYTRILSSAEYGVTDLLIQTGNLLIPIASASIANAVIRYGLERSGDKSGVFTTALLVDLAGFVLLLALSPLLEQISFLSGYLWLVLLYVLAANIHSVCNQFSRTMGHVRLFALDGILRTVLAIGFNLLLLAVLDLGITGYVLSSALADCLSTLFVFLRAGQWRYLRLSSVTRPCAARMLRYSIPLIPAALCGWIVNISDRYLIAFFLGSAATGLYAVANKIPSVLLTVANTFTSAWQLSALAEQPKEEKERFFSNVFAVYAALAFLAASGVIWTAQLSTRLLAAPEYYASWRYVPVLTVATTFACLGDFLSSVYLVEGRSGGSLLTTLLGAVCNLAGNALLIPLWGSMGAALSTLGSYLLIFTVRAVHTRPMLHIRWSLPKFALSSLLLGLQCLMMELALPWWPLWSGLCCGAVAAIHFRSLWSAAGRVLRL